MESTDDFHIGNFIKEKLKEQERSKSWLARKVYCDPGNFNKLLKKKSMDMDLLERISIVMNFNFCKYFADHVQKKVQEQNKEQDINC